MGEYTRMRGFQNCVTILEGSGQHFFKSKGQTFGSLFQKQYSLSPQIGDVVHTILFQVIFMIAFQTDCMRK